MISVEWTTFGITYYFKISLKREMKTIWSIRQSIFCSRGPMMVIINKGKLSQQHQSNQWICWLVVHTYISFIISGDQWLINEEQKGLEIFSHWKRTDCIDESLITVICADIILWLNKHFKIICMTHSISNQLP